MKISSVQFCCSHTPTPKKENRTIYYYIARFCFKIFANLRKPIQYKGLEVFATEV